MYLNFGDVGQGPFSYDDYKSIRRQKCDCKKYPKREKPCRAGSDLPETDPAAFHGTEAKQNGWKEKEGILG